MMRRAALALGLLTLALVWLGPLPRLAPQSFSAHMTMHMAVVAVAAPLVALGIGRRRGVSRLRGALGPIPASILELIVVWAWHAPALHLAARHSASGLVAEQGMFLASALLVWTASIGGDAVRDRDRAAAGVVALLLTSMHMTLLGALLALSPRPLYAHAGSAALDEQHLGGAIMLLVGGVSYLAGGLGLSAVLLRSRRPVLGRPEVR